MLLKVKNVSKNYGSKKALKDVNLEIKKGQVVGLLGPNGSGKTTLIKLINDLLTPSTGEILVNDNKVGIASKKVISYLPDKNYLSFNMRIKELIKYFSDFYEDFDKERAISLLEKLDFNLNDKLKTMSKGMKEKVQLILVMSRKADLYILDEPIGGVDPASRDYILDIILNSITKESSVIISTHLISDIEKILDEVIFISKGEIILHENREKIMKERKKSIDEIFREEFKC